MSVHEFVVFYAWQSDSPGRDNRSFIEKSLKDALKNLQRSGSIESSPRLDKDTLDIPGIPDIANTILDKIRGSDAFVADVSFVATTPQARGKPLKAVPNPNVMIELGYALAELGWERIILVLNTVTGTLNDLPFDLRNRRWPLAYEIKPDSTDDERAEAKRRLGAQLQDAAEAIAKLGPRQKRGTVEQRLSAIETIVASLSGSSAQHALSVSALESQEKQAGGDHRSGDQTQAAQQSLDSLVERVGNGRFHNVLFQQGMLVATILPRNPPTIDIFNAAFHDHSQEPLQISLQPLAATGWDHRVAGDRFVTLAGPITGDKDAATELLSDGKINAVGHNILAIAPTFWEFMDRKAPIDTVAIPSVAFEKEVIEAIARYLKCLKRLGAAGPWTVGIAAMNIRRSILFVSEHLMFSGRAFQGEAIRPPIVEVPGDVELDDRQTVARALRPVFDYIWREHNFPRSLNFAQTGDWVGQ